MILEQSLGHAKFHFRAHNFRYELGLRLSRRVGMVVDKTRWVQIPEMYTTHVKVSEDDTEGCPGLHKQLAGVEQMR